ncbi:MAG: YqgE/AlgH family protein [Parafilimonas sp.]|nr:YqgE/AlgH family protein [Parafilimonas sp.]
MEKLKSGKILIADPFLKDPNFLRTVIFLCEHKSEGSFGFVINRKLDYVVGDLMTELEGCDFPVFYGGPVQQNTIHFLHRCPGLITGGEQVTDEIYWGGEFDEMVALLQKDQLSSKDIRLYLGYSGWGDGQLENEMQQNTWLSTDGSSHLVFAKDINLIWRDALKQLGGKYEQLINYPIDPQLN